MTEDTKSMLRIFLMDDHPIVTDGLARLIDNEAGLKVCGTAMDVETAREAIIKEKPDVAVLDLAMGKDSGLELAADLRHVAPDVKLLLLSMYDEQVYAERALQVGALGYIMKEEAADRIIDAIRRVADGKVVLSERMTDILLHRAAQNGGRPQAPSIKLLSDRELETLRLTGMGRTSREIAEQLHLSIKTVDNYKERIKRKLELRNAQELARYAFEFESNRTTNGL